MRCACAARRLAAAVRRTPALLLVQLAGYGQPPVAPADSGWAQVREAQRRVAAEDAQSGLAIAIDIGDAYDIHPPNKQELGRRLARVARHVVYGEQDVAPSGPRAVTAVRTPAGVAIAFEDVDGALTATGAAGPIGFELCGSGAIPATASTATLHWRGTGCCCAARCRGVQCMSATAGPMARCARCAIAAGAGRPLNFPLPKPRRDDDDVVQAVPSGPRQGRPEVTGAPLLAAALLLSAATSPASAPPDAPPVYFDWFEYRGHDAAFDTPLPAGHYRNPVLAGFHADPSIVSANGRFYLVNSSFTYFPGIPVFESADLVHWKQIGNVIERPAQLDFDGLSVSRGIFAPTIEYHDGVFYVVTTATDSGGNFIATARDPAGPWSDPHWLPGIDGIDPSLFFDDDGKVYLINNDAPPGTPAMTATARSGCSRSIWPPSSRWGRDGCWSTRAWSRRRTRSGSKAPHLQAPGLVLPVRRRRRHRAPALAGGAAQPHRVGPYVPYAGNPILTQRELPTTDRCRSPMPAMPTWSKARMVRGGRCSWPAATIRSATTTPGARPICCRCAGRTAGHGSCRPTRPSPTWPRRRRGCRARHPRPLDRQLRRARQL